MDRRRQNGPGGSSSSVVLTVATVVVVVGMGLGIAFLLSGGSGSSSPAGPAGDVWSDQASVTDGPSLPDYVLASPPRVQEAYRFAAARPDVMVWMPCYCGCGDHSGHKSARNCFVKENSTPSNIQFDMHGAGCEMCVGIALDSKAMTEEGKSLRDIRAYVDDTYGSIGPGTDTPLPPG